MLVSALVLETTEALCEGAEAEEMVPGVDAGAATVGRGVGVEGVVGDPVDEAAGVAAGAAAVVVEGAFRVGEGLDVVVKDAELAADLKKVVARVPGEDLGDLAAVLVGVGAG